MWIWNRREIYYGYSMKTFSELRDCLAFNKLRYDYKIRTSGNSRFGHLGENMEYNQQYYLYVHKKDYDNAVYFINKKPN